MSISLEQLQTHLLKISQQVANQQENIKVLAEDMQVSRDMLESLLGHLITDRKPQFEREFTERHIELSERLEYNESQLAEFGETFDGHLKTLRERVDGLAQQVSAFGEKISQVGSFGQLESLKSELMALSSNLVQKSHFEEAIKDIDRRLSKLTRTQFKTNSLNENQAKHVEQALDILQDLGTRRDTREQDFFKEIRQEKEQVYQEARGEFAVALLPVLDGLEAALGSGERFIQGKKASFDLPENEVAALMPSPPKVPESAEKGRGLFARRSDEAYQRDLQKYKEEEKIFKRLLKLRDDLEAIYSQSFTFLLDAELEHSQKALSGWLEGLNLVRERFTQLLNEEDIVVIEPLGSTFDPHLHTAIEVVERDDITHSTVIEVIRKGYKHGDRVLRYPEVVVARAKKVAEPLEEPELLQEAQDLPSTDIVENIEEGLLVEPDGEELDEVVALTTPEPVEDFQFPAEKTVKENLVDLSEDSADELDQLNDSKDELIEASTDGLEPAHTSEELEQLVDHSKTPALEILPTEFDSKLQSAGIEKQEKVAELVTDVLLEDPAVEKIEPVYTTDNGGQVEELPEPPKLTSEVITPLQTTAEGTNAFEETSTGTKIEEVAGISDSSEAKPISDAQQGSSGVIEEEIQSFETESIVAVIEEVEVAQDRVDFEENQDHSDVRDEKNEGVSHSSQPNFEQLPTGIELKGAVEIASSNTKELSGEPQQNNFEVAREEVSEENAREAFWEEPLENTLETEASEVPLTVPESVREQALKEISWQLPAENTQDTLQENTDESREEAKGPSSQESVVTNKLKTALELAEGKLDEEKSIQRSSESLNRDENINQPENE